MMPGPNHFAHAIRRELQPDQFTSDPFQWGEVHAVHTSPNTLDLYLDGSSNLTTGVRYGSWYTPTVGDIVLVARMGSGRNVGAPQRVSRVVLGKLA